MHVKYALANKYPQLLQFLQQIRQFFASANTSIHKARNELKVIDHAGIETVVKSFKTPHFLNQIIYAYFRGSKAKKSFVNATVLAGLEIKTPEPIGYIEFYQYGLFKDSYFVATKYDYDFTIREPLLDKNFPNREGVLKAFARFTFDLHQKGIFHKDYSPGNILIKQLDSYYNNDYEFCLVDINRMQFGELSQKIRLQNFSKLWVDDEDLTTMISEYARFNGLNGSDAQQLIIQGKKYSNDYKNAKTARRNLKKKVLG